MVGDGFCEEIPEFKSDKKPVPSNVSADDLKRFDSVVSQGGFG